MLGRISTGAQNDLERITRMAYSQVGGLQGGQLDREGGGGLERERESVCCVWVRLWAYVGSAAPMCVHPLGGVGWQASSRGRLVATAFQPAAMHGWLVSL